MALHAFVAAHAALHDGRDAIGGNAGPIVLHAQYQAGAAAPTALALMRSRYTAYVRGAIDYLVATHDASTRDTVDVKAVTKWSRQTRWLGLEIVGTERGGAEDDEGVVEFLARGSTLGRPFAQRERSRFRRLEGRWYYIDGDVR